MDKPFRISSSPHIYDSDSVPKIMYTVILSLVPAALGAIYFFGLNVLWVILTSIVSAVITELIIQILLKRPIEVNNGSAIVTGILLAYNIPPEVPLWFPAAGSFFGICVGKMAFGGLGYNPMNPALLGRAFLMSSWPVSMTAFKTVPRGGTLSGIDAITNATALNVYKHAREVLSHVTDYTAEQITDASQALSQLSGSHANLFMGRIGGCIGETSAILLIIGGFFLLYRRIIGWKIPFTYIGTVALLTWILGGTEGLFTGDPLFHILSGGLMLGAFYMATDMVTSPVTFRGRILFGIGCGILTVIIRLWGGYPEGVSYAILLMNITAPLLDRLSKPKVFGGN